MYYVFVKISALKTGITNNQLVFQIPITTIPITTIRNIIWKFRKFIHGYELNN